VFVGLLSIFICKLLISISRKLADYYTVFYQHFVDNQIIIYLLRVDYIEWHNTVIFKG